VCKYSVLLEARHRVLGLRRPIIYLPQSHLWYTSEGEYPWYAELVEAPQASRRISDRVNEAQRRAENAQIVHKLQERVEDGKGYDLNNFGYLLLDHIFVVTKSNVDREYRVFLFEHILLCCKEPPRGNKGESRHVTIPPSSHYGQQRNTPLLLKGRIFASRITKAVPSHMSERSRSSEKQDANELLRSYMHLHCLIVF
jgi:cell division control protein 24